MRKRGTINQNAKNLTSGRKTGTRSAKSKDDRRPIKGGVASVDRDEANQEPDNDDYVGFGVDPGSLDAGVDIS